jgi:WD40 repeat protein
MCSVVFSPDGTTLATGGGNTIGTWQAGERNALRRWDVKTGKELATLESMWDTFSVAYNPDGKTLALGGDADVLVLDAATGKELFRLDGRQMALYALAFSRDGKLLASAGKDRTIKVWDMKPDK